MKGAICTVNEAVLSFAAATLARQLCSIRQCIALFVQRRRCHLILVDELKIETIDRVTSLISFR